MQFKKVVITLLATSGLFVGAMSASAVGAFPVGVGGTGWTNLKANTVLLGNGTGAIATTTAGTNGFVLALSAGVPSWVATSSINNGVTSIATTFPITGGPITTTGTITFGGLTTSTAAVVGSIPYFSGVNTFANVATGTITANSPVTLDNSTRAVLGGSVVISCATCSTISTPVSISNGGTATTTFYNGGVTFYNSTLGTLSQAGDGFSLFWDAANKRLGIGTSTPIKPFSVYANVAGGVAQIERQSSGATLSSTALILQADSTGAAQNTFGPELDFNVSSNGSGSNASTLGAITATMANGATNSGTFNFYTANAGSLTNPVITAQWNGFIGIASSSPNATLALGSGAASSSISVAEYAYGKTGNNATSTSATLSPRTANTIVWPIGVSATTLTLCNFQPGDRLLVRVVNPNASAGALTWAVCTGLQLYWPSHTVPTQTTTANNWDIWSFTASVSSGSTTPTQVIISGAQTSSFF